MMPTMKISMHPAVTVDGFIADLNGECYSWINPADESRYEQDRRTIGCELVGRKTYTQYQESYDAATDFVTFVYTHQRTFIDRPGVKFVHGSPAEVVEKIASYGFSELIFSGGGELNGLMASAGLIDEMRLSIHSVVLGRGIPLFGSYKPKLSLKLASTEQISGGVVENCYTVLKFESPS
jgi:dihydrofolate reductase